MSGPIPPTASAVNAAGPAGQSGAVKAPLPRLPRPPLRTSGGVRAAGTRQEFEFTRLITVETLKTAIKRIPGFGMQQGSGKSRSKPNKP